MATKPIPMNLTRDELERWAYAEGDTRVLLALAHNEQAYGVVPTKSQALLQAAERQKELPL